MKPVLAVIGVGLIGGSFARALKAAGAVAKVVGFGRGAANLNEALRLGVVDAVAASAAAAVRAADVVVVAVPVAATADVLRDIAPALSPHAVVTDVGSVKQAVITAAAAVLGAHARRFVPGHPIAGTEHAGAAASRADLFQGKRTILTPTSETDGDARAQVAALWRSAGAEVIDLDAAQHDRVFALTSHLPHLLAYALVDLLARTPEPQLPAAAPDVFHFAASGFRDFTRIASSDPTMWRDICLSNRDAIARALDRYRDGLDDLRDALVRGDGRRLFELFAAAKAARDRHIK